MIGYIESIMSALRAGKKVTRIDWDGYMALRFNVSKHHTAIAFYRQNDFWFYKRMEVGK